MLKKKFLYGSKIQINVNFAVWKLVKFRITFKELLEEHILMSIAAVTAFLLRKQIKKLKSEFFRRRNCEDKVTVTVRGLH